jgi:hypothetical protein
MVSEQKRDEVHMLPDRNRKYEIVIKVKQKHPIKKAMKIEKYSSTAAGKQRVNREEKNDEVPTFI